MREAHLPDALTMLALHWTEFPTEHAWIQNFACGPNMLKLHGLAGVVGRRLFSIIPRICFVFYCNFLMLQL